MHNTQLTTRQTWILKVLAEEGVASTNRLYIRTSPACLATNRTRALGTYGWKTPAQLQKMGLVDCHVRVRGKGRGRLIRYTWSLTPAGRIVAGLMGPIHEAGRFKGKHYVVTFD